MTRGPHQSLRQLRNLHRYLHHRQGSAIAEPAIDTEAPQAQIAGAAAPPPPVEEHDAIPRISQARGLRRHETTLLNGEIISRGVDNEPVTAPTQEPLSAAAPAPVFAPPAAPVINSPLQFPGLFALADVASADTRGIGGTTGTRASQDLSLGGNRQGMWHLQIWGYQR